MLEIQLPTESADACLDDYLADGWFRNGYLMARTPLILMDGEPTATISVRAPLRGFELGKSLRRVMRRNDGLFRVETGPAVVDAARERLYAFGAERFFGYMMDSLAELLEAEPFGSLFPTEEVAVFDDDRLVAVSYFDSGRRSVASLLGLYDPAYASYGLGIYTMLVEVKHSIERGHHYYYPGFVTRPNGKLDYKLRLPRMQYIDARGRWRSQSGMPNSSRLRERIVRRTDELSRRCHAAGIPHGRRANPFFLLAHAGILDVDAVEASIFLQCLPLAGDPPRLIVEYLPESDSFLISSVRRSREIASLIGGRVSREGADPVYIPEPLVRRERIWQGSEVSEAARRLAASGAVS